MKPELTMNELKDSVSEGPVILTPVMATTPEARKRNTKKYLIIGGSIILVIAIVLAAILVGMYLFTKAQTDLIKYTMNVEKDTKQDATVDQDDNSIEYHSYNDNYEMWVIDDYNKDIRTTKVKTASGTNCYIGPLNRTAVVDPATIKSIPNLPKESNQNYTSRLNYDISGTPVADSSFLGQKARAACKGTSIYWLYPICDGPDGFQRNKRCWYLCYWVRYYCYGGYYICTNYLCYRYC